MKNTMQIQTRGKAFILPQELPSIVILVIVIVIVIVSYPRVI